MILETNGDFILRFIFDVLMARTTIWDCDRMAAVVTFSTGMRWHLTDSLDIGVAIFVEDLRGFLRASRVMVAKLHSAHRLDHRRLAIFLRVAGFAERGPHLIDGFDYTLGTHCLGDGGEARIGQVHSQESRL